MRRSLLFLPLLSLLFFSCAKKESRLVLWTDNVEFVSYAELFNASQDNIKLVVHYQKKLLKSLETSRKEADVDLLAGSYLRAGMEKKYFSRLDSLVKSKGPLEKNSFYPALLQSGRFNDKQFLLPLSFNLPALVFYSGNYEMLKDAAMLSFEDIKALSKKFNSQNKDGVWTAMGFGPLWSPDFLYLLFKDNGVFYNVGADSIVFTENAFKKSVDYVRDWIEQVNGGPKNEEDFAFKYLYMPFYNQVQSGRCLFAYASSKEIFSLEKDQIHELDFRWICNDNKIQMEDDLTCIGIYSKSRKKSEAKKFITWLLSEDSQKQILDRKFQMNLSAGSFGVAGGFSSLRDVTERLFPLYYRALLSNTPVADKLFAPQTFPGDWAGIKAFALEPFILEQAASIDSHSKDLSERYKNYLASEGK